MSEIEAMFFPTSVLFIDDSRDFLLNFTMQLDDDIIFEIKNSPFDALEVIHARYQNHIDNAGHPGTTKFFQGM